MPQAIFGISVFFAFVVWGIIGVQDIWPALRSRRRARALRPLLLLHSLRFIGLAFLAPGVVSPDLPDSFARCGVWRSRDGHPGLAHACDIEVQAGTIVLWVFNIAGTTDLLYAFYQGNRTGIGLAPGLEGAAYLVPVQNEFPASKIRLPRN